MNQPEQNGTHNQDIHTSFFKPTHEGMSGVQEPDSTSSRRPPSNFQRKSPIPRVKYHPICSNGDPVSSASHSDSIGDENKRVEAHPGTAEQSELETEEPNLELEQELDSALFDSNVVDELSEYKSSDIDKINEDSNQQKGNEHEDLSSLKLPELRELAKLRGLKGFSKMKKPEVAELLSGGSV